jgi:hypothetical protein
MVGVFIVKVLPFCPCASVDFNVSYKYTPVRSLQATKRPQEEFSCGSGFPFKKRGIVVN